MNTHRSTALLWAILYLRDRNLSADPMILLSFVDSWIMNVKPINDQEAKGCGVNAARECGCPVLKATLTDGAWLEPEDLRE